MSNINTTAKLFAELPNTVLWEIANELPIDILQNLITVIRQNKHLNLTLMIVLHSKMNSVLKDVLPRIYHTVHNRNRPLQYLSDINLSRAFILYHLKNYDDIINLLQYIELDSTNEEYTAIMYINLYYPQEGLRRPKIYIDNLLDIIKQENTFRNFFRYN